MASFNKKIEKFLSAAVEHKIVDSEISDKLIKFSESDEYNNKSWLSLSRALGGLGALTLGFGIILIIATNWYALSDFSKFISFLVLMGGCHAGGIFANNSGYDKTASSLHFLGAGLFLAGIGLIAQIFNLYSNSGESYLLWAIMILPLAILLNNGPILLLSLFGFCVWGNVNIASNTSGLLAQCAFNFSVSIACWLGGILLEKKNSDFVNYLKIPGNIGVIFWLYMFGFAHDFGSYDIGDYNNIPVLSLLVLALTLLMFSNLWLKNIDNKEVRYLLIAMGASIFTIILVMMTIMFGISEDSYIEHISFGFTDRIYFMPMMISISAWIAYFTLGFWGVIYGALNQKSGLLNKSIIMIGIGVFTRFIDLMGTMGGTGTMFIICGLLLFGIGYVLENWRRKLILEAKNNSTI